MFLEVVFWLFHFGRMLRFWKAKCINYWYIVAPWLEM